MTSKRVKIHCDHARKEVEFSLFQLERWKDCFGVSCHGPGVEKSCRGEKGCALYEKFWFDGSIANAKQEKILKEAHRKNEWDEKCSEWLGRNKERVGSEE